MVDFGKILIISPHPDDEVLGCGGVIAKYKENVHVHYMTFFHPGVSKEIYWKEHSNLIEYVGCKTSYSDILDKTNVLHTLPINTIISQLETIIQNVKPETVFVCYPSYNQDHRVVYDALLTATRPHDINWQPKNILIYEQPETLHTNRIGSEQFKPLVFTEIDIEQKIKLYEFYNSQIRGHRGVDTLKGLAKLRGSFISKPYAEAFDCIRLTV